MCVGAEVEKAKHMVKHNISKRKWKVVIESLEE
jgi:hypothetical protein